MRWIPCLLVLVFAGVVLAQTPAPVLRVTTDSSATAATVVIWLKDRAVIFNLPNGGDMAYVSSVAAPNGKLSTQADSVTSISLRPGPIPGLTPEPGKVPPKALPNSQQESGELPEAVSLRRLESTLEQMKREFKGDK